jgi:hypothetical protein
MRKIIIGKKEDKGSYAEIQYYLVLSVPVAQQPLRADTTLSSILPSATVEEIADLREGKTVEITGSYPWDNSDNTTKIGAKLVSIFNKEQTKLNNSKEFNYLGTTWDGNSWTILGT